MLQAFLDESGIHAGATHFVLAGYVGGTRRWVRLTRLWMNHLADFGVTDFHATDLFGRRGSEPVNANERVAAFN